MQGMPLILFATTKVMNKSILNLSSLIKTSRGQTVMSYIKILIGALIVACAYVFFITPHKIIPGGVYGMAIIIHYKTVGLLSIFPDGLPLGLTALCFNIPLIIIAFKMFGVGFLPRTVLAFVATAVFTDALTLVQHYFGIGALVEHDILLSCIYGSAVLGFGVAIILKARGTSAGTDVLAKIITKRTQIPVGYTIIIVDSCIVLAGLLAFGEWEIPMYSLFTVLVYGKMVDVFMQGLSFDKAVFIISDYQNEIGNQIMHTLNRGGTLFHGRGLYQGQEKEVIYTVIDGKQVNILRHIVHAIDPKAFITIIDAKEIIGAGFKSLDNAETE